MPRFGGSPPLRANVGSEPSEDVAAASRLIDAACQQAVAGKLAVRDLATWTRPFAVSEMEFRLLWLLSQSEWIGGDVCERDQAELAEQLAVSAAHVSAVVERLRAQGLIEPVRDGADRRRQLWRVAASGLARVGDVVSRLASPSSSVVVIPPLASPFEGGGFERETAA
jgi:DNA-binding MarR family transcriptional regulator